MGVSAELFDKAMKAAVPIPKPSWEIEFERTFGDELNHVERNKKIVKTGLEISYVKDFIRTLLASERKKLCEEIEKLMLFQFSVDHEHGRTTIHDQVLERKEVLSIIKQNYE